MRLSKRGVYGLRTMTGLAARYADGVVPLSQIARTERISLPYLEQLARALREHGLVQSKRGARGGYRLALTPDQITVGDVLRALEGPVAVVECAVEGSSCDCARGAACSAWQVGTALRDRIVDTIDSTTLADLLPR